MKFYFWFSLIILSILSCKKPSSGGESNTDAVTQVVVEETYPLHNQKGMSDTLVQSQRSAALPILEHRLKEANPTMQTTLEKDIWHIEAVLRGSDVVFGVNLNGAWVDFKDGNVYTYGFFDKETGNGRYVFDSEKSLLLLVDNHPGIKPQEFETKIQNDALVLVGQSIYKDNNMQTKLNRNVNLPAKPPVEPVQ